MDILNGLYALQIPEWKLIWRMEQMLATGLCDVKLSFLKIKDDDFEKYVEKDSLRLLLNVS